MTEITLNFKYNGNTFSMGCSSDDTIEIVKMRLQDAEGLEPEKIILRYPSNQLLSNAKTLEYYGLTGTNAQPIEISVKHVTQVAGGGRRRRRRTKRRRTKRKGSKKRSRRTRKRR